MQSLKLIWSWWKHVTERIANFQAGVIFSILYFALVTPLGLMASLFSDSLGKKPPKWKQLKQKVLTLQELKEQ